MEIFKSYIKKKHIVYEIFHIRFKFKIRPIAKKKYKKLPLGVLNFSYKGFLNLKASFDERKSISINLGDYIQSYVVKRLCKKYAENILCIVPYDSLSVYDEIKKLNIELTKKKNW